VGADNPYPQGKEGGSVMWYDNSSFSFADQHDLEAPRVRCYHSHPPLPLKDGLVIYGGSCSSPVITDADIYVGLDHMQKSHKSFPWVEGESFQFSIRDMQAPDDPYQFRCLIDWLIMQLTSQKKVHVGCIGGHGRTGTVFSALVAVMLGKEDAIDYVRKNYCAKAVESTSQISFLMKHFGVGSVSPSKPQVPRVSYPINGRRAGIERVKVPIPKVVAKDRYLIPDSRTSPDMATTGGKCIWGSNFIFDK